MRVLRVSHSAVVTQWRERERELRRLGVDVQLCSARTWNEAGMPVPLVVRPDEAGWVTGVATVGGHPALFLWDPRPLWSALGEQWDLLDLHEEPFALGTAQILLLARLRAVCDRLSGRPDRRTPYVLYSAQNLDKRYPPPFGLLQRLVLRAAAGAYPCNDAAATLLRRRGLAGRAAVVPLGFAAEHFAPDPRRRAPGAGGPVVLGYAGRLSAHKGLDVLLGAAIAQPRIRLRIAGSGPLADALVARVADLGLGARVEIAGGLDQEALPGFYRGLDVLAVPSLTTPGWIEQFGRVVVEAMACGIPVVASDSGALPDLVAGVGHLVPPGDPAALAAAACAMVDEPGAWNAARERGLARASRCTWTAVAQAQFALYRSAVAGAPDTAATLTPTEPRPVEVVVVAYGAPELLDRALAPMAGLPVTVVDNSSDPQVHGVCRARGVRLIDPGANLGFAAAVNLALVDRLAPGADVLLLNPDARIEPADVAALSAALRVDPALASVAPAQADRAGRPARVGWPFPSPAGHWLDALGLGRLRRRDDYVIGSVLLLRAEALEQVGGFDDGFFLYAEETDWARRASRLGWRHTVVPEAWATHDGAGTSTDPDRREAQFAAGQERYVRKHFGRLGWASARLALVLGSAVRALAPGGERRALARRRLGYFVSGPTRVQTRRWGVDPRSKGDAR